MDPPLEPYVPPPETLTLQDLMNETPILIQKELNDKALIETIGSQSIQSLKPQLVEWVLKGCPAAYVILSLDVQPPNTCSDGVARTLQEYVAFCSGKTIQEHVAMLQVKLPDIFVSFANISGQISVIVSKA